MNQRNLKSSITFALAAAATIMLAPSSSAQSSAEIAAKLYCGPHTANPAKLRAFQADLRFAMTGSQLRAVRELNSGGEEEFVGMMSPNGIVMVMGTGDNKNGGAWVYEFRGQRSRVKDTVISGRLESTRGAVGTRKCSLAFLKPRAL